MKKSCNMKKAAIISVGNELLSGLTTDTNSAYLARKLAALSIPVCGVYATGDEIESITRVLTQAAELAEVIIVTGGLGPTDDDLTRQAMARFLRQDLQFHPELMRRIDAFFELRGISAPEKNKIQAYIPAGAEAIENNVGTAPGIFACHNGRLIACLPGVPFEMHRMFEESVATRLAGLAGGNVILTRRLHCFGAGESIIAGMLGDMMDRGRNPLINCTVDASVVTLHIVAAACDKNTALNMIENDSRTLYNVLGNLIYGDDGRSLAEVTGQMLKRHGKTIALAESCTGGLVARMLTDVPGSSDYFLCGWVTYSNQAKINQLGIESSLIEKFGAVSSHVVVAMACAARKKSGSDIGIGITGIAGPDGGTAEKPVGLVFIAVDFEGALDVEKRIFSYSREYIRTCAALYALNMVRQRLLV